MTIMKVVYIQVIKKKHRMMLQQPNTKLMQFTHYVKTY